MSVVNISDKIHPVILGLYWIHDIPLFVASDSDEAVSAEAAVASAMAALSSQPAATCSATLSPSKRHSSVTSSSTPPPNRPAKYNFNLGRSWQ